jgi:threonine dehydrogenase-like Zn-dependent dehydrogenase
MRVGPCETPACGPREVLVSVRATGVCAGDLYIYQGKNPYAKYPIIGGHEICGTIAATGAEVATDSLAPGTLVVVEPFLGCGRCYPCRIGKSNCCAHLEIIGVHRAGGFAEFVTAPATHIHRVPSTLTPTWASFAEPVAIAVQACRRGLIAAGEYVLILGAGPIGLAVIEVVKARGAHPVVADINPTRLDFARRLGAIALPAGHALLQAVLDQTGGDGAPVVIEATGSVAAIEQTVELVAPGGRIVILGLVARGTRAAFPGLDFTRKEMTVLGSRASVGCFPEALDLLARGLIRYPEVATELSLWDAPATFARLEREPACMHKAVLLATP